MLKYINLKLFLFGLIIGFMFIYLSPTKTKTVLVYPTPQNYKLIQYKDRAENCFQFNPIEVTCPDDKTKLKTIPIQ